MEIIILIVAMVIVGLVIGFIAGLIWKNNRPIGVAGDYIASVITTVIVGFMDWYLIPALGFSDTLKIIGIIFEPALGALLVLWIIRKAKQ
jgi:uncharacterized membrane protein YeaQ/YmgE (transglycosylase-associated protein family)